MQWSSDVRWAAPRTQFLHLITIARSVGVPLAVDDFQNVSGRPTLLADFRRSGPYVMEDPHNVGGLPAVLKFLLQEGLIHGDYITVTGRTVSENFVELPALAAGQQIVRPISNPLKRTGHIQILKGNLAREGAVAKITGKEGMRFPDPQKSSIPKRTCSRPWNGSASEKATSSLFDMRDRREGPACPRCSRRLRRSSVGAR